MKVLVIGGAGYIGSHVVKELMAKGHQITVFDNLSSGLKQNLFKGNGFIKGDILNIKALDKAFAKGFDAFIHLAAFKAAGESMVCPEKYSVNNISGTINILNSAVSHGCLKMVFSSSAATFGEPQYLPIDENHPQNPENYYGFTKLEIERFMGWYDKIRGLKFAALRYFNAAGYDPEGVLYGLEKNPANLLPVMMEVAAGIREKLKVFGNDYPTRDGTCIRDYIHVTDLARAHVMALEYISSKNESLTLNLGTGNGITVTEMLAATRRITGKEIPADYVERRAGDPAQLTAKSDLAFEKLGWKAEYSDVDTLIDSTWKAYKKYYKIQ
ncbi:MAG: UDP-glucose 4-epimerase GalE [Treponema sp.]|nr:UDP-glucose 4-epimerase GalE [Spirochaetia bacterium]MDD7580588.1 UDP-glucose 4-epimerase GalE [Treponema sp.]MDY3758948.1 UDP-glucose 4-epimerase GalE [Treponema sp.]MDY4130846.1 UDP-glucose 4-epimerase GalE [Treponema sp.]MDY5838629.1 UDP-glucose 4-epimerase GalE [Treponema sp.]